MCEFSGESHSAAEKRQEGPLEFFKHPFFCKIEKIEVRTFGDIKKWRKKSHKAKTTCTKKLVKEETRTYALLLGRYQKNPNLPLCANYISVAVKGSQLMKLIKSVTSLVLKKKKKEKSQL